MTGMPLHNFPAFNEAEEKLRHLGWDPVNPAKINPDTCGGWETCLRKDIVALMGCDTLVLLPGWQSSKGAHLELHVAHRVGIHVTHIAEVYSGVSAK